MSRRPLTVLHTSDWHLGRTLYGRQRYAEFAQFLDWLVVTVQQEHVDVLLVAGDVFDTSAPSNRAQQLYYRFLCQVAASDCRHVVVIAGNHDSPSFLNAPQELLKALNVHVVGAPGDTVADEVLVLQREDGEPELIVCAVPYLRDRAVRTVEAGESIDDKQWKLIEGIRTHYAEVAHLAAARRAELAVAVPVLGMGHVFTAGGKTAEGDGVRELAVGTLAHLPVDIFPDLFAYVALGHLHVAQTVGGCETIRYSGSPLPMGFGEVGQEKRVCLVRFNVDEPGGEPTVSERGVPVFQELVRVVGGWEDIVGQIAALKERAKSCWLEVIYDGDEVIGSLRDRLEEIVADSPLQLLRIKNDRLAARVMERSMAGETLDDLDVYQVFQRCLEAHRITDEQRDDLQLVFREAVRSLLEDEPTGSDRDG